MSRTDQLREYSVQLQEILEGLQEEFRSTSISDEEDADMLNIEAGLEDCIGNLDSLIVLMDQVDDTMTDLNSDDED